MKLHIRTSLALLIFFSLQSFAQTANDRTIFVRFNSGTSVTQAGEGILVDGNLFHMGEGSWRKAYKNGEKLDELRQKASARLKKELPDLNLDYRLTVADVNDIERIIEELNEDPAVFYAKKAPRLANAAAPDYQSFQTYLNHEETGINADEVWSEYENHGEGVRIFDVEYGYNPTHLDLPNVTLVGPEPEDPFQSEVPGNHGTAVLGEMGGLNDGIGVTGICYESEFYFAAAFYDGMYQLDMAMLEAVDHLEAGDILLIEQQAFGPIEGENQLGLVPVEWVQEYYDVIQLLVGLDIIVVEAAGNGQQNLDDAIYQEENFGHYPFVPGNGSGAILVGAGSTGTTDVPRSSMWYSNHGSAVHLQGNGESIYSTGYGTLYDESYNELYTYNFGGTSGASPIVTGAISLLVSTYRQETGQLLTKDEVLEALLLTGQPQQNGTSTVSEAHIGPLPDVKAAIDYLLTDLSSVKENGKNTLLAYPNPAADFLTVNCSPEKVTGIYDIFGKSISLPIGSVAGGYTLLETQELPAGVYFLEAASDNGVEILKINIY